jgi:hypothetical protein
MKTLLGVLLFVVGGFLAVPSGGGLLLCLLSFRPGCFLSVALIPPLLLGGALIAGGVALTRSAASPNKDANGAGVDHDRSASHRASDLGDERVARSRASRTKSSTGS